MIDELVARGLYCKVGQGRNEPIFVRCLTAQGKSATAIVKWADAARGTTEAMMACEAAGNIFAQITGVGCVKPALVHIDDQRARGIGRTLGVIVPPGIWPGSYQRKALKPLPPERIAHVHISQAWKLYVFDMIAENDDRQVKNPNCGIADGNLIAFDFETCFPFVSSPIVGRVGPSALDPEWARGFRDRHVFGAVLRRKQVDETVIRELLATMTTIAAQVACDFAVDRWKPTLAAVSAHLEQVAANADQLIRVFSQVMG